MRAGFILVFYVLLVWLLSSCATSPPKHQDNLCRVLEQQPQWYDYAKASEDKWGTPAHIAFAFVKHESAYVHDAKPPLEWFLFVPLGRPSSAKGYAQVQNPAWSDYTRETGGFMKGRGDMEDALDFIGWYNDKSAKRLGISKQDPKNLYLAYHEGHTGYRRGNWKAKPSCCPWLSESIVSHANTACS